MRGRSHLNVSAIIKKLSTDAVVRVVVLRGEKSMEKAAVTNFTHFLAALDDVVCKCT